MKKGLFSSQHSWENLRVSFPKEERTVPWLSSLLDAYAMIDASVFIALEAAKRTPACGKGCSVCCSQSIPLTYLELFGIQWFNEKEKRKRLQRDEIDPQHNANSVTEHRRDVSFSPAELTLKEISPSEQRTHKSPCPLLKDNVCSVYVMRPIACRRFLVFERPCQKGEDCLTSRPADVLHPSRKILERALLLTQPFYEKTGQWKKAKNDVSPFFEEFLTEIRQFDWSNEI